MAFVLYAAGSPLIVDGAGAIILPGAEIGENSIIAAGSVVTRKFVPSNISMSGDPARSTEGRLRAMGKPQSLRS